MKNYYDQVKELEIAYARLATLEEKKKIYFQRTQPKSKEIDKVMVQSSKVSRNVFLDYTEAVEPINKKIEQLKEEINFMERYLKKMEASLREMKGIKEKIFVAKYIDGLNVKQISSRTHYSPTQVYRYLKEIYKTIKDGKKW